MAIIFFILSFFTDGSWAHFVPVTSIFIAIWLKIIQSGWDHNNYETVAAKTEPGAALEYLRILVVIYIIISLIFGLWIPLIICSLAFILSLTMKFPHPY